MKCPNLSSFFTRCWDTTAVICEDLATSLEQIILRQARYGAPRVFLYGKDLDDRTLATRHAYRTASRAAGTSSFAPDGAGRHRQMVRQPRRPRSTRTAFGLPSVAFQLRHIARSLDRFCCYAEGNPLTQDQLAALASEMETSGTRESIFSELEASLDNTRQRLDAIVRQPLETPISDRTQAPCPPRWQDCWSTPRNTPSAT